MVTVEGEGIGVARDMCDGRGMGRAWVVVGGGGLIEVLVVARWQYWAVLVVVVFVGVVVVAGRSPKNEIEVELGRGSGGGAGMGRRRWSASASTCRQVY